MISAIHNEMVFIVGRQPTDGAGRWQRLSPSDTFVAAGPVPLVLTDVLAILTYLLLAAWLL